MNIDQKNIEKLQSLIEFGEGIESVSRRTTHSESLHYGSPVNSEKSYQWGASCLNILKRVFGEESDHYQKFNVLFPKLDYQFPLTKALGIMRAAKDDYENGYLSDTRILIQAEVFDDFLDQAEHLFGNGYHEPAAVMAGAVLEDGLRKLCTRRSLSLPAKPTIDPMNVALAKDGAYSSLVQKRITALADLRNKAAHGKWSEFSKDEVKDMLAQVRSFMEAHFS